MDDTIVLTPSVTPGNAKLGPLIYSWSLPAGRVLGTCPGASLLCEEICYAQAGHFYLPSVQACHRRNWEFSKTPEFIDWMRAYLRANFVRVMRIHVAGDFYDQSYVRDWHRIVGSLPDIVFFAYTRSWRDDTIMPDLIRLAQLPNMSMWFSIDRETGPAPVIRGVRRAYMAINDVDASLAPDDCDLVFRDNPTTVMKRGNGVLVCPPENGVHTKHKITCSKCGICWDRKKHRGVQWENSLGPYLIREINAPAAA